MLNVIKVLEVWVFVPVESLQPWNHKERDSLFGELSRNIKILRELRI